LRNNSSPDRFRLISALILSLFIALAVNDRATFAYTSDTTIYTPPSYLTFTPPAVGGSYTDPVFGSAIKRLSSAMTMQRADTGGIVTTVVPEYSSMSPFNQDNTRLLIDHFSYFALYDGAGNLIKDLPMEVNASSQPRWSRTDPNVFYYIRGNQLKQYNVGTSAGSVVHTFSEYSTITGMGESDISFDGNHFVLAGNSQHIFVYEISTDRKGAVLDSGGRGFDSLYITPNNNVTVTWKTNGNGTRFTGIEVFDSNMNFLRQLAHAGGHMDVTRDSNGDEVVAWISGGDPWPLTDCVGGLVKIRIADAKQTCVWSGDWTLAAHVSAPDNSGWAFLDIYSPTDVMPAAGWKRYTNELIQVKLDGTEVRRLAHHRSRPFDSYTYQPKVSVSRDGSKLVFGSNFGLQPRLGYPANYTDTYFIDLASSSANSSGTASSGTTTTSTTTAPAPTSTTTTTTTTTAPAPAPAPATTTTSTTTAATVSRVQQNGAGVTYSGTWYPNSMAVHSGASAVLAAGAGARATKTFTGTAVTWIAYRDQWSGIAKVYVDGTLKQEVDTYASPTKAQTAMYSITELASGSHSLAIEVTGRKNASSGGAWVWIDAFDVTSTGTATTTTAPAPTTTITAATTTSTTSAPTGTLHRIEQNNAAVKYSGTWATNSGTFNSGASAKLSMAAGARASLTFTGNSVSWIAYRDQWSGIARVYIDGVSKGDVDTYASPSQAKAVVFKVSGLSWGTHTIIVEATGRKNASSQASWVWVDAFDYSGATLTSALTSGGGSLLQVGSAEVTAGSGGASPSGLALIDYRPDGILVSEAGVPASAPVLRGRIFAEVAGAINTGFAVANPNESEATVSFFFTGNDGTDSGWGSLKLPPHTQLARFLNEQPFSAAQPMSGTFSFSANIPVSAIALRGFTNERAEFLVTTLPIANLDQPGSTTVFFPHFAAGGGWTTQFVLINPSDETIAGTLDFSEQGNAGSSTNAMALNIEGTIRSSVPYVIPAKSSRLFVARGEDGLTATGSARANPDASNVAPVGVAVFSFKSGGVTVSEAGVPSVETGKAFRLYVEEDSSGAIRSGIAITTSNTSETVVHLDLSGMDGTFTGRTGSVTVPAGGQRSVFLDEIAGFETVPMPFKGILRIYTSDGADIAVVGLRGRSNERGDFLLTTTAPTNELQVPTPQTVFPHIVNGNGYTTDFVMYSGTAAEPATGTLNIFSQTGESLNLGLE
jgi:hypothetical protein